MNLTVPLRATRRRGLRLGDGVPEARHGRYNGITRKRSELPSGAGLGE